MLKRHPRNGLKAVNPSLCVGLNANKNKNLAQLVSGTESILVSLAVLLQGSRSPSLQAFARNSRSVSFNFDYCVLAQILKAA